MHPPVKHLTDAFEPNDDSMSEGFWMSFRGIEIAGQHLRSDDFMPRGIR